MNRVINVTSCLTMDIQTGGRDGLKTWMADALVSRILPYARELVLRRELGDGFATSGIAIPEQIYPVPQPVLSIAPASRTSLQLAATCGFGGNFYLLRTR